MNFRFSRSLFKSRILPYFVCFGFLSCNNEPCTKPVAVKMGLVFWKKDENDDYKRLKLTNWNLELLDAKSLISKASLLNDSVSYIALSKSADSLGLFYSDEPVNAVIGFKDSLSIVYQRNTAFVSESCGFEIFYRLKTLRNTARQLADSFKIVNPIVDSAKRENIYIYLKD